MSARATWRQWLAGLLPKPPAPQAHTRFTVKRPELPLSHFIEQAPVHRRRFRLAVAGKEEA